VFRWEGVEVGTERKYIKIEKNVLADDYATE
jgi:hypothetical protein